jgi:type II secretory pathway pseudopilin PulG
MRASSRDGFTLIEVLVVVSTLAVLGSTSLVVLTTLEKIRRSSLSQSSSVREIQRLADELRLIAHNASDASVDAATNSVLLVDSRYEHRFTESSDKMFVDYVGSPRSTDDAIKFDRFKVGAYSALSFERVEQPPLVSVNWKRQSGVVTDLRIEAALTQAITTESETP